MGLKERVKPAGGEKDLLLWQIPSLPKPA